MKGIRKSRESLFGAVTLKHLMIALAVTRQTTVNRLRKFQIQKDIKIFQQLKSYFMIFPSPIVLIVLLAFMQLEMVRLNEFLQSMRTLLAFLIKQSFMGMYPSKFCLSCLKKFQSYLRMERQYMRRCCAMCQPLQLIFMQTLNRLIE